MEALSPTGSPFKLRLKDDFTSSLSPFRENAGDQDDAAALFQQLQLLRNENRKRWGEPAEKRVKRELDEDLLADFKDMSLSDDLCERKECAPVGDAGGNRMPLKALTNKRDKKHERETKGKKNKKRGKNKKGKKSAKTQSKNKAINNSAQTQSEQANNALPAKRKQSDDRTSTLSIDVTDTNNKNEQSIGISAPMYQVCNDAPVDPSLLFDFTFPKQEEGENIFYDDSPTADSSLNLLCSKLEAIEECEEDTDSVIETVTSCANSEETVGKDEVAQDQQESNCVDVATDNLPVALGPLLGENSLQKQEVLPDYYADETWTEEDQFCLSESCPFLTAFANLFISKKRKRNCVVLDGCEL